MRACVPSLRHRSLRLAVAAITWSTQATAQDSASARGAERSSDASSAVEQPAAPVVIDGRTLFRVRGILAYPAEQRAAETADRIREVASDRNFPVESLSVRDTPLASLIVANGRRVLVLVDADAELEGTTRQVLIRAYQSRVAESIAAYRHDREAAVLLANVAHAALATIAIVLGLLLGRRALRRLRALVDRRYRSRMHDIEYRSVVLVRSDHLRRGGERVVRAAAIVLALVATYIYLDYVLLLFPWTRGLGHELSGILLRPLATLGMGVVRFIPDLIFLVVIALVTRYAIGIVRLFFRRVGDGTMTIHDFEPEWALPTERIVVLLLLAVAMVMAYPYIPGSGSEAFKGIGLLLGLMVSLGSPSVVGNALAGVTLAFRRAFKVGDRVRIGEYIGDVAQVRLLTTYLRSPKNEQIVIPNSLILNSEVVNFSTLAGEAGVILHTSVRLGYETPWRQVEAMLVESARRTRGLLVQPEPFVLHHALGEFAVEYEINAYCDDPHAMLTLHTALHRSILDVFNEYGVQIMTPNYEGDPERPKVVPPERWFAAPASTVAFERGDDGSSPIDQHGTRVR